MKPKHPDQVRFEAVDATFQGIPGIEDDEVLPCADSGELAMDPQRPGIWISLDAAERIAALIEAHQAALDAAAIPAAVTRRLA